ncbi:MAG: hypothetical protein ACRBB0_07185 [Pelagimonas sp.]|uniref:hypothetical protein n=1 Tax=Pelagimonas sp. TaxID=2073170 RepID=UPI003D6C16F1
MKHSKLHSVAHNYADSLAGGLSFVVPNHVLHTHVFAEAAASPSKCVTISFLTGHTTDAYSEGELENVAPLFKNAFPAFCDKHGVDVLDYVICDVRFSAIPTGNQYSVTVEERNGRRSTRDYVGVPPKRLKR